MKGPHLASHKGRIPVEAVDVYVAGARCEFAVRLVDRVSTRTPIGVHPEVNVAGFLRRIVPVVQGEQFFGVRFCDACLDHPFAQTRLIQAEERLIAEIERGRLGLGVADDHRDSRGGPGRIGRPCLLGNQPAVHHWLRLGHPRRELHGLKFFNRHILQLVDLRILQS